MSGNERQHTKVTPDWHRWIAESLHAGSRAVDILQTMIDNGFAERAAWTAIDDAYSMHGTSPAASPTERTVFRSRLADGHELDAGDRTVRVLARIARPAVAVLDGVLSAEECRAFRDMAARRLTRSAVVDRDHGRHAVMDIRTSDGAYFQRAENELVALVDRRVSALMHLPEEHGEGLQVMRYGIGGEYQPHFDYFDPADKGSLPHLNTGGQRVSTLIMYLNDVEAGGETIFPRIDFSVVPREGQGLYFEYDTPEGGLDPLTLHGGAPVTRGEKWIVTKWMRERAFPG
ncbi:2OG-Fe(II) oxygenase [Luteibacter sp. CQ10]|uniref:2OG-Fe(II) oxygenase n=1 Tax=Luteibacter sp. CQ10 TaxID=2805821 RepID=UPI0034A460A5